MSTVTRDPRRTDAEKRPTTRQGGRAVGDDQRTIAGALAPQRPGRWSAPSGKRKPTRKIQPAAPRRAVKDVLLQSMPPALQGVSGAALRRVVRLAPEAGEEGPAGQRVIPILEVLRERDQPEETAVHLFGAVDLILLLSVVLLLGVGTIMVYSASMDNAFDFHGNINYYLVRQVLWVAIGFTTMVTAMRVDYHRWRDISVAGLVITILLLLLVKVPHLGWEIAGAQRWLRLPGGLSIQPSEMAKLGVVVYAAHWLSTRDHATRGSVVGLLPLAVVSALVLALILRQPDLGTTTIVAVSLLTVYFVAGARLRHLAVLVAGAAGILYYMLHHISPTTHWGRQLAAFLADPHKQADGAGFHMIQAFYALGSGGLSGVGLGGSLEKAIIPAPQTDSIFAILGEELGLIGTLFVLLLFLIFAYRGLRASVRAPDEFGRLVAAGLTASIFFQAVINMAVMTRLLPFSGVPLPFISFGGSSLAISMGAAGVILNISKFAVKEGSREHEHTRPHLRWGNRGAHLPGPTSQPIPFRRPEGRRDLSRGERG